MCVCVCVCVCGCVRERERERERVCVCVCVREREEGVILTIRISGHRVNHCRRTTLVGGVCGPDPYMVLLEWNQASHCGMYCRRVVHCLLEFPFRFQLGTDLVA